MSATAIKENLIRASAYFREQQAGYKTWGNVEVLQIAQRLNEKEFVLTEANATLHALTPHSIATHVFADNFFGRIFASRKKVNTILLTRQQFASQLKEDVPAILDDQAQLLGVSIRFAPKDGAIISALNGRFAATLFDGTSICLGSSIEDAYVAAQLLEKTAKTWIEAKHIGGAKAINKVEAWFMQQYYLFKYSKEAVKNK